MDPCSASLSPHARLARFRALRAAFPSFRPRPVWLSPDLAESGLGPMHPAVAQRVLEELESIQPELLLDLATDARSAASLLDPNGNNLTRDEEDEPRRIDVVPSHVVALSHRYGPRWTDRLRLALLTSFALGERTAERFLRCGTLGTVEVKLDAGRAVAARIRGSRCRCRWCPACQSRHGDALRPGIVRLVESFKWPVLLTLTIRHEPDDLLRTLLDRLLLGWKRARRTAALRGVSGGVRILEVKRSSEGWHPHLHILADARWINVQDLRDAWEQATGGSTIVDVRRIRTPEEASAYVAKYLTKAADFDDPLLFCEYLLALKGVRMAATFGDCVGTPLLLDVSEIPEDDADDVEQDWRSVGPFWKLLLDAASLDPNALAILRLLLPDWHLPEPAPTLRASPTQQTLPF